MTEEEALALLESLTVGERKEIDLADFAWPEERKFPCDTQEHVDACAKLLGHAPENKQAEIKARAIRIAKRHGFSLPQSWQDEKQESAASVVDAGQRPRKKIATLKVRWLCYEARSENGRIYPRAICDQIYRAAVRKLADPNALPVTCFISHETANNHVNTALVGRVVKIWQEGNEFYANIDLADTTTARDMLALAEGGYLQSESLRVRGVQLAHDRNYDLPIMVVQEGVAEPELMGIDLTTRPGFADSARILQTLYESSTQETFVESFQFDNLTIESREEKPMALPMYQQIILAGMQEAFPSKSQEAHARIHDHLAGVLDSTMGAKHGNESARLVALVEAELSEAGAAIAKKHAVHLIAAHDEAAKACAMECEGCYGDVMPNAPSDTDNDGDNPAGGFDPDNDGESHTPPALLTESTKEEKTLTPEEMIAALKAQGFQIEAPKTTADELAELKRIVAEQSVQIKTLTETAPQRQTLANQSQFEEFSTLQEEQMYEDGDYLKGDLAPKNWKALSNRRVPWPAGLDPKLALHEMAPFLAHTLNMQEAHARGRDIGAFIAPDEIM